MAPPATTTALVRKHKKHPDPEDDHENQNRAKMPSRQGFPTPVTQDSLLSGNQTDSPGNGNASTKNNPSSTSIPRVTPEVIRQQR